MITKERTSMTKIVHYTVLPAAVAIALLLVVPATLRADAGNRGGTAGAIELLIPVGSRDIAMGGSTISSSKGVEALYWNPAGAAWTTSSVGMYFSHMSYIADIGVDYGAVSAQFEGFGVVSLSLKSLAIGDIIETTTQNPDGTGKTFTPQFFTVGLTYSRQLSDRIGVGLTTNFISERMGDVSANGVAFSVGVIYENFVNLNGLSLGVVVKNVGPQMSFDGPGLLRQAAVPDQNRPPQFYKVEAASFELPSTIEFGLGYRTSFEGDNSIMLSGTFQNNNFSDDEYKLGAEYGFQDIVFLRGGYLLSNTNSNATQYIFGPTFGAGVHTVLGNLDVTFDYAFRSVKTFENNHVFSVKLGF
jgi:hypothetical protein